MTGANGRARDYALDLSALSPAEVSSIAHTLRHDINEAQSKNGELRFGTNGSLSIDLNRRTFYDHEAGEGGGVLAFVQRERGYSKNNARKWIAEHLGYISGPPFRITATWDYVDRNGVLLKQIVRAETGERDENGKRVKRYWQRRPSGNGEWVNDVKGVEPVPYQLPDLTVAITAGETVYITEGEKCADVVRGLGLTATTNAGGASKWSPRLNRCFKGADVAILPDNDDAGQKHIRAVARQLAGTAASVRIVDLSADIKLPPKGDVEQWLERGGTKERLIRLAVRTPPFEPEPEPKTNIPKTSAPHEEWTELGNAHRLVRRYGNDIRYVHPLKAWFIWDGTFWRRDDDGEIMRRAEATIEALFDEARDIPDEDTRKAFRKFALKCQTRGQLEAMVQLAQHNPKVVLSPDALDSNPMLLGVLNGTINLARGEFREGHREDYITKRCGVAFDPDARCPNWEAFQTKIAVKGDTELIPYKQRMFGLTLTGVMTEILFIMHGGGSNGKTTELETVAAVLGDYACAAGAGLIVSTKEAGRATPEIVRLKGRRAVFINETGEQDHLNESRVKYLTGNDTMSGRDLYESTIDFKPTHKPILRTNYKPEIRGTDWGIWRRIHFVPYLVTITENEKDEHFRERMLIPELPGILNWMLAGCKGYLAGGLRPPSIVTKATKDYQQEMNTVGQWISSACESVPNTNSKLTLATLYSSYTKWANDEIGWAVSKTKLAEQLREHGFVSMKSDGVTKFLNIRLVGDDPDAKPRAKQDGLPF